MDLNYLIEMITNQPLVLAGSLGVGYIVKRWIKDVDNKYIPTIVGIVGIVLGCVINGATVENAITGMISGLASTGLYEAFRNVIGHKEVE